MGERSNEKQNDPEIVVYKERRRGDKTTRYQVSDQPKHVRPGHAE
jgi:hypothetical protein